MLAVRESLGTVVTAASLATLESKATVIMQLRLTDFMIQ